MPILLCSFLSFFFKILARAEEEAISTPTKLTNQLFVKSAMNTNNLTNTNSVLNGEDSLGAATFVSVVSHTSRNNSLCHYVAFHFKCQLSCQTTLYCFIYCIANFTIFFLIFFSLILSTILCVSCYILHFMRPCVAICNCKIKCLKSKRAFLHLLKKKTKGR